MDGDSHFFAYLQSYDTHQGTW